LDTLTEIVIPEGVKEIGNNAFNITGLTSVTLPVSLEVIGEDAFSQIWSLKSLHLPKNVRSTHKTMKLKRSLTDSLQTVR